MPISLLHELVSAWTALLGLPREVAAEVGGVIMSGRKIGCGLNTTRVLPRRDVGATRVEGFGFMRALCSVTRRPRHHRSRRGPWEHAYPSYVELLRAYNTEFVNRPKKSGNTGKTA